MSYIECGGNVCAGVEVATGDVVGQHNQRYSVAGSVVDLGLGEQTICALRSDGVAECAGGSGSVFAVPALMATIDVAGYNAGGVDVAGGCQMWPANGFSCPAGQMRQVARGTEGALVTIDTSGVLLCAGGAEGWTATDCPQ
jgi:hypothetical protein